jgi:2-dehydro-3-deoxygluconokinase
MITEPYDVVTFGETMLRLSPPGYQKLEQAQSVDIHIGGSESNVAVGLARLGLRSAWFSALTDNGLGRYIETRIAAQGVDTSHVLWMQTGRVGTYWIEQSVPPRATRVIYDRSYTAISQMQPDQLPTELFQPERARLLHVSGITPALSPSAAETTLEAVERAKQAGWKVSFDINYRAKLWDAESAREWCVKFIERADIIFSPFRDVQTIFANELTETDTAETALQRFYERYPKAIIVFTTGASGAIACGPDSLRVSASARDATPWDRIGAGDAFIAAVLSQIVKAWKAEQPVDLELALRWGNAAAALKYTIPGDFPLISVEDVEALVEESSKRQIDR